MTIIRIKLVVILNQVAKKRKKYKINDSFSSKTNSIR